MKTKKTIISTLRVGLGGYYVLGINDIYQMGLKVGDRVRVTKIRKPRPAKNPGGNNASTD
jgi:hypothetical protein